MIRLGITGTIGSGKSFVCNIFRHLGFPVFDSDLEAKKIYEDDPEVIALLQQRYGGDIYLKEDGSLKLNKDLLAKLIFSSPIELTFVNKLIHPRVRQRLELWQQQAEPLSVLESALLFDSGLRQYVDYSLVVLAPKELRLSRVMERSQLKREEILARMQRQLTDEEMGKKSDFAVCNDGERFLLPQIYRVLEKMGIVL